MVFLYLNCVPPKQKLGEIILYHSKLYTKLHFCKVVIYNYVFCWLLFRAKFDCNYIQYVVPYM